MDADAHDAGWRAPDARLCARRGSERRGRIATPRPAARVRGLRVLVARVARPTTDPPRGARRPMQVTSFLRLAGAVALAACAGQPRLQGVASAGQPCDPDNGGITLPTG